MAAKDTSDISGMVSQPKASTSIVLHDTREQATSMPGNNCTR